MTTAQEFGNIEFGNAVNRPAGTVSIAGVPWPTYKVVALLVGVIVFAAVAVLTTTAAAAVLSGAGAATVVWLGAALLHPSKN
ncbi:MAG: hypothetical protein PGN37_17620 [Mycobacterium kyogaense]|uniref:hypothetical protein n=1 Tax=Mycobacterium kyogaense TaxID=2212479 RepID=UPI002FFC82F2